MAEKYYMIGNKAYVVVIDYKNGYNYEAFRDRYSEVLDRYDYIVGDWGYNQLRLKGFFREDNPKATKETSIATLQDYLNEYCNFGCAYFVVEKVNHPPADGEIISEPAQPAAQTPGGGGSTDGDSALPMRYNRTGVVVRMTAADRSYAEDYALERRRAAAREAESGEGAWGAYGRGREYGAREWTVREAGGREHGHPEYGSREFAGREAGGQSGHRDGQPGVSVPGGRPVVRPNGREAPIGSGRHDGIRDRNATGAGFGGNRHEAYHPDRERRAGYLFEKPGARSPHASRGAFGQGPGGYTRIPEAPERFGGGTAGTSKGSSHRPPSGQTHRPNERPTQRFSHPKYTKDDRFFSPTHRRQGPESGRGPGKPSKS